ncbi:hypothetical protein ELUMI_v1c05290 [Williamsoniiplasma luminosum]|uniref:Uncharacterized protein n=1 Tax=Williamsoniiplasma luminosum TaxID=214888 RepID=A0A2K8NX92_9MOLU|nr:hypothetical protein [Williamsoniiplasma luminosum]ATZ17253.1 hypothetical protein ELUMI_v1c05290 [Williamsoniiplasma luminosum]
MQNKYKPGPRRPKNQDQIDFLEQQLVEELLLTGLNFFKFNDYKKAFNKIDYALTSCLKSHNIDKMTREAEANYQDDEEFTYCRRDCGDEEACVGHDEEFCEDFCDLDPCPMRQDDDEDICDDENCWEGYEPCMDPEHAKPKEIDEVDDLTKTLNESSENKESN